MHTVYIHNESDDHYTYIQRLMNELRWFNVERYKLQLFNAPTISEVFI